MSDFNLDTTNFATVIARGEQFARDVSNLKYDLEKAKDALMYSWVGQGRNTFEKKYRLIVKQLGDISEEMEEITEGMRNAEQSYIQADTDSAKGMDGVSNRGDSDFGGATGYVSGSGSGGGGNGPGGGGTMGGR